MENLFVYGTLRTDKVRKSILGRKIGSQLATLNGYKKERLKIAANYYPVIRFSGTDSDQVDGEIIKVSSSELELIDQYESDAYKREKVLTECGVQCWVYLKNESID